MGGLYKGTNSMRTEEAERAADKLGDAYSSMMSLYQATSDDTYFWQAKGIYVASKAIDVDIQNVVAQWSSVIKAERLWR
jgi:hypothetical protein